jgi:hypothetical protein
MHISLDSALGRQRRLNSVGESVLQIAPSAAAAYSLRSLTGGDPRAVRVRRDTDGGAGDNDEQDFTASEVSSGALVAFVGSGNEGFVETWYDQSGNGNDAVQATAGSQPKIVNAGTMLNELDFDGTDDNFELTSVLGMTSAGAIFSVAESGGGNDKLILDNRDGGVDGFRLLRLSNDLEYRWQSATVDTGTNLGTNTKFIAFANHDGSNASAAVNGATATTTSDTSSISVAAKPHIGARSFSTASNFWDGTMNELIIYNSDQNANRAALQTNINSHYSIF